MVDPELVLGALGRKQIRQGDVTNCRGLILLGAVERRGANGLDAILVCVVCVSHDGR